MLVSASPSGKGFIYHAATDLSQSELSYDYRILTNSLGYWQCEYIEIPQLISLWNRWD